ncbi:tetratricopeptide repeat protein, partial [Coleofasciculus sp. H7-2]|uniref:tetratricopeptide repeat protein n=1 Tax=Coleofasciculus sp. H7-2 TaxID=3351545 RepID=UPI003672FC6C
MERGWGRGFRLSAIYRHSLIIRVRRCHTCTILPPCLPFEGGCRRQGDGGLGGTRNLAQQPAATSQDPTRAAAERAFLEGLQLYRQGTAESLRQAIAKWEEALPLYRAVGDKKGEAVTLNNIGGVYSALGEKQKALLFYNQSLP